MNSLARSLHTTLIAAALGAIMASPAMADTPKWADKSPASIVEFAVGASGSPFDFDDNGSDFDILVAALIDTNTIGIFDGTDFTVFAPNDQAFYNLTNTDNDEDAYNAVVNLLGVEGVAGVLAYHVTDGVRNSRSVVRAKQLTMLDGNTIMFDSGLIIANGSEAGLVNIDNRLADGMVHIIDTVLIP
ncbi:fasciclin domain-containing protein [Pseudoalteromonas sp. BDTF-M6]|uniref:fasciclin domain-containing protein n=1 Tax=Pseudoalteromonas sp. BDTF-M6 TaxID=2796132 RepID=UPI001BAF33E6|nr:fasciclin domain-containing protein [Pseudoalteromonas sp. BDTF-M6]MBS3797648.1 fasciclin domain-containing protein [Pseudoalteromonas sp. BDTF-M6]